MSVTIDPRRHDAVLFDTALDSTQALVRQLQQARVGTATFASGGGGHDAAIQALTESADRVGARPGRCVVITTDAANVAAARDSGFALVIGVDQAGHRDALPDHGADTVLADLDEVRVRAGDRHMSELPDALQALGRPDGLTVPRPAVFFDFDGTLSEIVDDPDAATPTAGAVAALQQLAAQCPVAILSGRDLADVSQRVGLPGIWYAGSHGFELTAPDGTHHQNEAAAAAIPVLEQAAAQLRDRLGSIPGVMVEHKRFGVATHYRNAARDRVGEIAAVVRAAGQRDGLRVTTGREVIELRPDIDWDKGKTLRWVIDHLPDQRAAPLVPIYLGDDITDEDAFDAVGPNGVAIMVRHNEDGDRATAALFALESPARVAEFTGRLASQLSTLG
ncbi:trehalose-phosphatase [Mycobacterium marinum]|uniref:trehalose-phosphatase n=1 Tax=Mycobacterium marinum TaxID=1781 RepID=UPI00045FD72B|nr:trehalose-phosphatase [Mycobacterium marinum]AXN43072.1 Trehalose-phosphate phosphatase [Mycobacterium marinum]AXN48532.1 Trehalose-phosphate phosphatase [Mycobacterium marinum]RFZ07293.1 Trehalose-phosphate phosphatase [Mycobacterium marinum]RFZ20761.1 Trehalose-phosphate phosphatase [Mycobacterium marinum]RFZ20991.1 Trehalose-phosphate phosphatase [Mycobacterium marinum]